jgi:putative ATP-binding cassette transporter
MALDELERAEIRRAGRINRCEGKGAALRLRNLSVTIDGRTLVTGAEVAIMPGEKVLVTGESGSGKSTLVRALAGLWPWGEGDIEMPAGAKLLLLPQRPYVPNGTLRRAASYPDAAHSRSVEEIARVLKKVGLGHLLEYLNEERPWDQTLSGGEKQRLAFARILLHRPDIIVLDEATGALDSQSERELMKLLSREFEHATVVSVGHRSELEALHGRRILLQRGRQGAKLVSDVSRIPRPGLSSGQSRKGLFSRWNASLPHGTFRQAEPATVQPTMTLVG